MTKSSGYEYVAVEQGRLAALMAAMGPAEQPRPRAAAPVNISASGVTRVGAVAIVPVYGYVAQRPSLWAGTSADVVRATLARLVADRDVEGIVLDVDSPGGGTAGVTELAAAIREARKTKPVAAVANALAASAAYWIASSASRVVATPSAEVGSIGVYAVHVDQTAALEQAGLRVSVVSSGRFKTEASPFTTLSEEARAHLQSRVDAIAETFIGDVAAGRGVSADVVRSTFGQGRLLGAEDARRAGMVDAIGTLESAVGELSGARGGWAGRGGAVAAAMVDLERRRQALTTMLEADAIRDLDEALQRELGQEQAAATRPTRRSAPASASELSSLQRRRDDLARMERDALVDLAKTRQAEAGRNTATARRGR